MKSHTVGLSLSIAIAIHNVPEGVAVALPVYFATKSRWLGFKYAFLSGATLNPQLPGSMREPWGGFFGLEGRPCKNRFRAINFT